MKRIIIGLAAVSFFCFSACTKCTTCTVKDKDGNIDSGLNEVQECGTKKEVEEFEKTSHDYAAAIGGEATCVR